MASDLVVNTDPVQKFFQDLEAQKTVLSTCTQLFTTISNRFTSLQTSLSLKSQSLESKLQSLESSSSQTLQSLSAREISIPERESAAAALVEEQTEAAFAEFDKPISENPELAEALKSYSRKMDFSRLLKFIVTKRKEAAAFRSEISQAIAEAVDPPRLVLDAVDEFLNSKSGKAGVTDKRWACGMLVQALFPEGSEKPGHRFARSIVEKAATIVEKWKGQLKSDKDVRALGPGEVVMFLQIVVGFGLRERFDEEMLKNLVIEFASRRDMAKLVRQLEFGEKLGDIIEVLVKNGKEIEAIYFASESGLTERFPPLSLLKSYLRNSKNNAAAILKNGNNGRAATEESSTLELNSIKAIIKCVEDHKLESEFSLDSLRKRAAHLEKTKADRNNKRAHGHGGSHNRGSGPPFRSAKAAKYSNPYPPFNRRNPVPPQHSPASRYPAVPYNYPSQSVVYETPASNPYASTYSQSPAGLSQQHYSLPVDNIGVAALRSSGSYGGQTSYAAAYDPSNTAQPSYPTSYTQ